MQAPGWIIPVADDMYLSPEWQNVSMKHFAQCAISFEFFNDYDSTTGIPSDPVDPTTITGFISFSGKFKQYSIFDPIPNAQAIDLSNPTSVLFSGQVYQLQAQTNTITGCNYIRISFDREEGTA